MKEVLRNSCFVIPSTEEFLQSKAAVFVSLAADWR